jgi:MerR HTH family regulatory protein
VTVIDINSAARYSADEVCSEVGITYRMLDYWLRKGYITIEHQAHGSGTHRRFTEDEVEALRELVAYYIEAQNTLAAIANGTTWAIIRAEQQLKGTSHDESIVRERHPSARRSG